VATDKGVPQGGIISPLLSNLVLHELDLHMMKIMAVREKENAGKDVDMPNPVYSQLSAKIAKVKVKPSEESRDTLKGLYAERRRTPTRIPNPSVTRLKYARYADDWLVGV
jgi:hypothetical protein